jgi:hypothetical protein
MVPDKLVLPTVGVVVGEGVGVDAGFYLFINVG